MSQKMKTLKALILSISILAAGGTLVGCSDTSRQNVYEQEEDEETVYIQDSNGNWMSTYMFMSAMDNNNRSSLNYGTYKYATKTASGDYVSYTPTEAEFSSMKTGGYTGRVGNAKPKSISASSTKSSSAKSSKSKSSTAKASISKSSTSSSKSGVKATLGGSSTRAGGAKASIGG